MEISDRPPSVVSLCQSWARNRILPSLNHTDSQVPGGMDSLLPNNSILEKGDEVI